MTDVSVKSNVVGMFSPNAQKQRRFQKIRDYYDQGKKTIGVHVSFGNSVYCVTFCKMFSRRVTNDLEALQSSDIFLAKKNHCHTMRESAV